MQQIWPLGPSRGLLTGTAGQMDEAVPATKPEITEVPVRAWYVDVLFRFGHWALYI